MKLRLLLICAAAATLAAGCGPRQGRASDTPAAPVRDFPLMQIPAMYSDGADRQAYAAEHYWDRFFSGGEGYLCDSLTVLGVPRSKVEEHFSTFVSILGMQDVASGRKGMESLFSKVEAAQMKDSLSNVLEVFSELAERYLYDPNSPFRNEDLYQPYVQGLADSPLTDPAQAPAYAFTARNCALNGIGTVAADFRFTDVSGRTRRLHDVRASHTLLFFSNPGCEACKEIIETLKSMPFLPELISSGRLAVVNVYIDGDIQAWKDYQAFYPREWFNGYDPDMVIREDLIYDVRAIPSLYVLDADKRVIMKDAPEERVFSFLERIRRD
jgi:thiol-disulfide isomerase/thioredoxin